MSEQDTRAEAGWVRRLVGRLRNRHYEVGCWCVPRHYQ